MLKTNKLSQLFLILVGSTIVGCATPQPTPVQTVTKTNEVQTTPIVSDEVQISNNPTMQLPPAQSNGITGTAKQLRNHRGFMSKTSFSLFYSGDIAGLPRVLKDYDSSIRVSIIGKPQNITINLDADNITANDLQEFVKNNSSGKADLLYNSRYNSVQLVYHQNNSVASDAIKESLKWQDGGTPSPVLHKDGLVLFPFGQYEPKVTCQPLQLCDIQLQPGEIVKGLIIGDSVRWNEGDGAIPVVYSGDENSPVPHIVLKPSYPGLNTTLLITSDRRTYYIKLYSSSTANLSRVGFYYPADNIKQLAANQAKAKAKDDEVLSDGAMPNVDPRSLYFKYKISGDTSAPFNPVQVFDDGTHVYIQMPNNIKSKDLPAFYVLGTDDETLELVNFRFKAPYYVVDKIFDTGVLVLGLDDDAQRITIKRK